MESGKKKKKGSTKRRKSQQRTNSQKAIYTKKTNEHEKKNLMENGISRENENEILREKENKISNEQLNMENRHEDETPRENERSNMKEEVEEHSIKPTIEILEELSEGQGETFVEGNRNLLSPIEEKSNKVEKKKRTIVYKFVNEDIEEEYTSFSSINLIVEKVPITSFEKFINFTDEEKERFNETPGLYLFEKIPEKWEPGRVQMWLYLYGFSFLQESFWEAKIDGDQFLFLKKEEVSNLCPSITELHLKKFDFFQRQMRSIYILPKEIWGHIISYLEIGTDWLSLLLLSRIWYSFIKPFYDPNISQLLPLRFACKKGFTFAVREMLSDPRLQLKESFLQLESPLGSAARNGHYAIVKLLLEDQRIDPTIEQNYAVRVALHANHKQIVELLLNDSRVKQSLNGKDPEPLFPVPEGNLYEIGWVGMSSREIAESILKGTQPGTFLVRWSPNARSYVISFSKDKEKTGKEMGHILLSQLSDGKLSDSFTTFDTLFDAVAHYKSFNLIINSYNSRKRNTYMVSPLAT